MMKRSIYIVSTALVLLLGACNDWLTVVPETTIEEKNAFSSDMGIEQSLAGLYIVLSEEIYGPALPLGGISSVEALASSWRPSGVDIAWGNHDYEDPDVETANEKMFSALYFLIANANLMLNGMVEYKDDITPLTYNMARGEGFAIRALAHFELLRLYGSVPSKADASYAYLPYVTIFSSQRYAFTPYEKYVELLRADLDAAEILLKENDPVLGMSFAASEGGGVKWSYRKSHVNYYAVLGIQARLCLWLGDKEGALRYARLLRDAKNPDETAKLTLVNKDDSYLTSRQDWSCYCEQIFGTYCDYYNVTTGGLNPNNRVLLNVDNTFAAKMFHNSTDFRATSMYQYVYNPRGGMIGYIVRKYDGFRPGYSSPRSFPVMRLAEVFLMIAECAPLEEANAAWKELCEARDFDYEPLTEENRLERIKWEYIREFMGEGQNFFTYKRFNERNMWFAPGECSEEQYRIPIPKKEYVDAK